MKAEFNEEEKEILQGQASKLAKKHGCSRIYVNLIIKGDREIKSELSKKIYSDMQALIDLLSPDSEESEKDQD